MVDVRSLIPHAVIPAKAGTYDNEQHAVCFGKPPHPRIAANTAPPMLVVGPDLLRDDGCGEVSAAP